MDDGPRAAVSRARALERAGLLVLVAAAVALWLAYPVAPTFDSTWSLVWGREVWDGQAPSFEAYRVPTEHPLWVLVSVLLVPLGGEAAPRAMTLVSLLSLVAALAGLYRLGRATLGAAAGAVAVVLLATRLDFGFWAVFAFVDVPYLALLVWAAALEAERPRRGGVVWVLLAGAGLLRPEAWLVGGAYALWVVWPRRRSLAAWATVSAWTVAPVVLWALTDLAVTGNPAYSFTMSTDHAAELGRDRSLLDLPRSTLSSAAEVVKPPVLLLALAGLVAAVLLRRRRPGALRVPVAFFALGLVGFLVVSASGFSVIPRYFATAALPLMLLAGFALGGWATLPRGARARTPWAVAALVVAVGGGAWQATRLDPSKVADDLRYREQVVGALQATLDAPAARDGRRCGPTSVPNHLLAPYAIWHLDVPVEEVVARTDRTPPRGVALFTLTRRLNRHPAFGPLNARLRDPALVLVPPPGYSRAAFGPLLATYVAC